MVMQIFSELFSESISEPISELRAKLSNPLMPLLGTDASDASGSGKRLKEILKKVVCLILGTGSPAAIMASPILLMPVPARSTLSILKKRSAIRSLRRTDIFPKSFFSRPAGIGDPVVMGHIETCEDIARDNFLDSDIRFLEKDLDLTPGYILPRNLLVNHFFKRDEFVITEHDPKFMVAHLLRRPIEPSVIAGAAAVGFFIALRHHDDDEVFHLPDLGLYRGAAIASQGIDPGLQVVRQFFAADGLVVPDAEDNDAPFVFAKAVISSTMRGLKRSLNSTVSPSPSWMNMSIFCASII